MRLPAAAAIWVLCLALVVSGCAATVAGQAEMAGAAAGAVTSSPGTTSSAPSAAAPGRSSTGPVPGGAPSSASSSRPRTTGRPETTRIVTTRVVTTRVVTTSRVDPTSSRRSPTTGISATGTSTPPVVPGLSPDCNEVEAAITAFGTVFDGATSADAVISPATADAALRAMPASGLPAQPQGDVDILRTVVSSAGGRTLTQLALGLADGKATNALEDLATWASQHCS